ncbi:MAG: tetratricopeptide repeat protein [Crocinitomicaceae bacterium]|jgi:tetratricopeptide (TPR) repeat protein|nr:tetratricopeptide repeat protein [Crocinitomicaceae bacterium]MDP4722818.1 tetratricopeptide repeat protein [Crocinitomicaceae bacterium]MDP4740242.1 tetratricopeptide repeat protein [Crocinitomicaceae bacterium]MDP4798904.1 tetratricopeptide repeat protein [Crocinitomicaceae bacterium]MDP4805594.1 tetratricopeptide repeat protein [Crocinitomicaceae bacterium]
MKKQLLLAGLSLVLSTATFAQKKNVTDAILLMRKYNPTGEIAANKKIVTEAKSFIDLAAVNPETAEDFKMHLCRAQVYYSLIETATLESASTGAALDQATMAGYKEVSVASFKKVIEDPKKAWTADAQNYINGRADFVFNAGIIAYNAKKYEAAADAFMAAHEIKTFLGEDFKDAEVNTSLAANYAVEDYLAAKKYDDALAVASRISEAMPKNIDILISLVNINLQKGDVAATEKYINKALELDPQNKQLYYVLGTSYMDKKENDKATAALQKALEIDPAYNEALYQLGAHLYNLAVEKRNATLDLDYRDPKAVKLEAEAMDLFKQALAPLEKYAGQNPDDKAIMDILYKTNMKLGNIDKAQEYKKRLEALKN